MNRLIIHNSFLFHQHFITSNLFFLIHQRWSRNKQRLAGTFLQFCIVRHNLGPGVTSYILGRFTITFKYIIETLSSSLYRNVPPFPKSLKVSDFALSFSYVALMRPFVTLNKSRSDPACNKYGTVVQKCGTTVQFKWCRGAN